MADIEIPTPGPTGAGAGNEQQLSFTRLDSENQSRTFDYAPLGANVAVDLRALACRIRGRMALSVIDTGRDLKEPLPATDAPPPVAKDTDAAFALLDRRAA